MPRSYERRTIRLGDQCDEGVDVKNIKKDKREM